MLGWTALAPVKCILSTRTPRPQRRDPFPHPAHITLGLTLSHTLLIYTGADPFPHPAHITLGLTLSPTLLIYTGAAVGAGYQPMEGMECCSHHPFIGSCQLLPHSHVPLVPAPTRLGLCRHCLDWGKVLCYLWAPLLYVIRSTLHAFTQQNEL